MRLMDKLGIVHTDVNIDDNESICEQLINEGFKQMPCRESGWRIMEWLSTG